MTVMLDRPAVDPLVALAAVDDPVVSKAPLTGLRWPLLGMWFVALFAGMALVIYGFGPFAEHRAQHKLLRSYRHAVHVAANEATGLAGVSTPTKSVDAGAPVAIVEIGAVRLREVVVEGVGSSQTRNGPGHVPGTAGLGQPGNSVVVARRAAFGGPFSSLGHLGAGKRILVTTTQGQSVYEVASVKHRRLRSATSNSTSTIDNVFGASKDDRLTLVTSAGVSPWNHSHALVVVATLKGTPFAPTPQGARRDTDIGTRGERGAIASAILAFVAYGVVMAASIVLYRRLRSRTAYLLTVAPLLALTMVAAETVSRLFPAWA